MTACRRVLLGFALGSAIAVGACAPGQAAELSAPDASEARTEGKPLAAKTWGGKAGPAWKDWERLVNEQKFQEAADLAGRVLEDARKANRPEEWVRALVRSVVARTTLHGYETAVRFLKDTPWPQDPIGTSVLGLYYAASLQQYLDAYGWEIRQREKVASAGPVDLKAWTADQIRAEALAAFGDAWSRREALGAYPASTLGEYLHPNDFPKGIRPTLRDAVTYLAVEALDNSSGWTPEQSNEVFRLDLGALLAADGPAKADALGKDVHPLAAVVAALADLESWHAANRRPEAALEARLERDRRLHGHFTEDADRARILADLRARMAPVRDRPWWAMAKAQEADFLRGDDAADALVKARDAAREGATAYPRSPGGLRCASVVAQLEGPGYGIEAMASDGPGHRSIGVNHRNLDAIHFRAWSVDIDKFIAAANDYSILPDNQDVERLMTERAPEVEWTSPLPTTADLRDHRTYVVPPPMQNGFWVVAASARAGFPDANNQKTAVLMSVGDLVLLTHPVDQSVTVTAASGATGRPVEGASITLYQRDWRSRHRAVDTRRTGADGTVTFDKVGGSDGRSYFLVAHKGADVAIDPGNLYLSRRESDRDVTASLVYTDRSVYRPGHKVQFKVVAFQGRASEGRYRTLPNRPVQVSLHDANGQDAGQVDLVTNVHGTASGEMPVPAGRLLGGWSLRTSLNGWAQIQVEEYKRPTFEAKMLAPEAALRLNRPATLKGEARYYFGLPVATGKVAWKVTREPQFPWWWWWRPAGADRVQIVANGTTALAPDGTFTIAFTPAADERLGTSSPGLTYRYRITADVTDEGGETRSAERAFRLGFTAVEATLGLDRGFVGSQQSATMNVTRTDLDGAPAPGAGTWRLVKLVGPAAALLPADILLPPEHDPGKARFQTEGDRLRPRWAPDYDVARTMKSWADGGEAGRGTTEHDAKGLATVTLPPLPPGAWRLKYETVDAFGATFETSTEFLVAGRDAPVPLAASLVAERSSVTVGGTARLLARTGLADTSAVLEVWRSGIVIHRRVLPAGAPAVQEFPVAEADRGGFTVTLTVLRDHQAIRLEQSIFVPWDDKELKVEFATFRDLLRPGGKETWTLKVTGPRGKDTAVAASELLAYMYDRSLDVFAPHSPPSPVSLYPGRTGADHLRSTLGNAPGVWIRSGGFASAPDFPAFSGDRLAFFDGYGVGGPGRRGGRGGILRKMANFRSDAMAAPSGPMMMEADATVAGGKAEEKSAGLRDEAGSDKRMQKPLAADVPSPGQAAPESAPLRSNFAETAFWQPHLVTGKDGTASITFTVPDSVTSWNVWVHAVTRDLASGSVHRDARSVKDLMVRPYMPRFFREGDTAVLKVVVNNASDKPMTGTLALDLFDPATNRNLLADFGIPAADARRTFTVPAGGGTDLSFDLKVPAWIGTVAAKVQAVSGNNSDGELRPVPVLPGRMHLMQSRFVTLKDAGKRTMTFADLAKGDDPTLATEQMVVTVDAQLFYSVLSALPYLVNYPYECSEQTLNRFLSTGILTSMFDRYPAVAKMARQMAKRDTQLEAFDAPDPNRKMALEETPWLIEAQGGAAASEDLIKVLDPQIAKAQRDGALETLKKAQTASGGFSWFPGGPPSPYMTLYVVYGFSKALEFGVDVPRDVIVRAWAYLHRHYVDEIVRQMKAHDVGWEFVTFLNYVLSNYPDDTWTGGVFDAGERTSMLDFGFKHWRQHSPYLKGYLALTLKRMGREKDGRLVWASVMDSAKTAEDQGTFWAQEDRSWLWYNDTIETHAFALRTSMELTPADPKIDGMVLWLFLNKKLNHWKSTRATSEVVYSLAKYLQATERLGIVEDATVVAGGQTTTFTFQPDQYTGKKNQIVIPGAKVDPQRDSTITVSSSTKGMKFASATWHFATDRLPPEASGDFLGVTRTFYKRETGGKEVVLRPLKDGEALAVGDEVEVHLSLTSKHPVEYVHLRDPRGSGFEPVTVTSRYRWDLGLGYYEEVRDSGENFFFEWLPQGQYTFTYRVRASMAGTFKIAPATVQPMYAPEFSAYSAGDRLIVGTAP